MKQLEVKYYRPIEREYEAWIIQRIEDYFKAINKRVTIFAVSPAFEHEYPADEVFSYDCKLIGLQFKRTTLAPMRERQTSYDLSNVKWDLQQPTGQFDIIKSNPTIYYCLPTFVNREFKSIALHHSIFWRPTNKQVSTSYWYSNLNVSNNNGNVNDEGIRWGQFIESLYNCDIGVKIGVKQFRRNLIIEHLLNQSNELDLEGLYALMIEL